ncbi:hypothetical protein ENBRE01_3329, partial [Enteropsectra breve]
MASDDLELFETIMLMDSSSDMGDDMFYSKEWLEGINMMSETQFQETFRMQRSCFNMLEQKLINEGSAISNLRVKLLIFVFYISHMSTYRKLREIFGVSHATLHRVVGDIGKELHQFAIREILFPLPDEYENLKNGFLAFSSIEGAILAIDGTQIKICRPSLPAP